MSYLSQLLAVAGVMLLACISPGPDLIAVTSHALARRRSGIFAALGIATAHALWATLAVFGLGIILSELAWLYGAIRISGAIYLVYLGIKTLVGLRQPASKIATSVIRTQSDASAYRRGLLVGLTNPKAAAFFGSLFITILPAHAPMWVHASTIATVVSVSLIWFISMALVFSTQRVQNGYHRVRKLIDAVMGSILIGLGAKLALDH